MDFSKKSYWTDDDELVEKYVLGKLSSKEMKRLDDEITDSEASKEKLRYEMELAAGIRRHARDEMKKSLKKKIRSTNENQFQRYNLIGLAAAVVIILIGVGIFRLYLKDWVTPKKFVSNEIIFKQTTPDSVQTKKKEPNIVDAPSVSKKKNIREQHEEIATTTKDIYPIESEAKEKNDHPIEAEASSGNIESVQAHGGGVSTIEKQEVQSIWLVGQIIMIAQEKISSKRSMVQNESQFRKSTGEGNMAVNSSIQQSKTIVVKRGNTIENFTLQQRSYDDIPTERQQQRRRISGEVETLLEKTSDGLLLTIYDDTVQKTDFQSVQIETNSDDSLVVVFPNQKIVYRLPSEWSIQQTNTFRR